MGMEILTLSRFILELSLQCPSFVHQPSSKMAAACLCLAMKMSVTTSKWDANHCFHSGYSEDELVELMRALNEMIRLSDGTQLKTIRNKYSHPVHFSVAKTRALAESML